MNKFYKAIKYRLLMKFGPLRNKTNQLNKFPMTSFFSMSLISANGETISLEQFRGKKILLVNTASACGYTPQYSKLQKLHEEHKDNLVVIGFPCNDFGKQEPAAIDEVVEFCTANYGVTFLLSEKINITSDPIHPIYQWLSDESKNGWNNKLPDWNFCKYLLDENGKLLNFYSASVDPFDILNVNTD